MFKRGRRCTTEFKEEAVRLVLVQGLSISQVARDVGASQTTISKWVAKARLDGYEPPQPGTNGVLKSRAPEQRATSG
jgi:transposase-like protein